MATNTIGVVAPERGIEMRGIERVSAAERHDVRVFDNFTMWLSANLCLPVVAVGALAVPVFQMGFWDSALAIMLFNCLGALPVAFFATLGPKLGLRQMTISRFSFGWIGAAVMALVNVAACIGWSAVPVIVSGQLVYHLTGHHIPIWGGILGIAILTAFVSIYGYHYVHRYNRYAWIPMAFIFAVLTTTGAKHFQILPTPMWSVAELAAFVSFGGAVFGLATSWSSYAADYNVNQPEGIPSSKVFWLTFLGVIVPCILMELLGLALSTGFKGDGAGDLAAGALKPLGATGTVMLGFLALSVIAGNIPNDYSLGLSMQVVGRAFSRVNRAVWTVLGAIVYVLIAIPCAGRFDDTLKNFLLLVAYWLGPWSVILILEHFVYRKGKYNAEDWDTRTALPAGWAAMTALALGLVGVYLGAAQTNFVGPLAKMINPPFGMDIGFELGMVIAGVAYLMLRPIEIRRGS
ncbi:MAG: cytosine permease [Capsulimonadaceae bacterium]|nr:cytosine permease [Capsulimonadaceae bacterium]